MNLREAIRAWRDGDAAACNEACHAAAAGTQDTGAVALLRALGDCAGTLIALKILDAAFGEERLPEKARVLRTIALARIDRSDAVIAALTEEVHRGSRRAGAEAALALGLLEYDARNFVAARAALAKSSYDCRRPYARALECAGWIAKAEGDVDGARARFDEALGALDAAATRDALLEANLLAIIGNLAVEALDVARWRA